MSGGLACSVFLRWTAHALGCVPSRARSDAASNQVTTDVCARAVRGAFWQVVACLTLKVREFLKYVIAEALGTISLTNKRSKCAHAYAYARSEKFDALRGEVILRDVYAGPYGQTLNQTREGLKAAQDNLPNIVKTRALDCVESIGALIQAAPTQPFNQAHDRAAVTLASEL